MKQSSIQRRRSLQTLSILFVKGGHYVGYWEWKGGKTNG